MTDQILTGKLREISHNKGRYMECDNGEVYMVDNASSVPINIPIALSVTGIDDDVAVVSTAVPCYTKLEKGR